MKSKIILAILLATLARHWADAQQIPTFTKITQGDLVTDRLTQGFGVWGDYDNDGRLDVLVNAGRPNQWRLYHNDGNALFSAVKTGVMSDRSQGMWGAWGDPDNDGDLDFFAGRTLSASETPHMYWNDGHGNFVRETVGPDWTTNHIPLLAVVGAWGDFDRDGFADAFLSGALSWLVPPITNALLHNNGDGTFGVVDSVVNIKNDQIQYVCAVDYDNDCSLDLIIPRRDVPLPSQLYHNDGHGVFTEATPEPIRSEVGAYWFHAAWADFDNDGDLDVLFGPWTDTGGVERFYVNNGDGTFSPWAGQPESFMTILWGGGWATWGDFDNDGYLDLFNCGDDRFHLWRNLGNNSFEDIDAGPLTTDPGGQSGCWVDVNNDGFLDLFIVNLGATGNGLYLNNTNANHWLEVKLRGVASDRLAVGAKIFATANIRGQVMRQMRVITASDAEQTLMAHFGLGDATKVNTLRIEWPIGIVQELSDVTVDQILSVTEQQAGVTNTPSLTVSKAVDGSLQLTATGQTDLRYVFEASTDLAQWTKIAVRANLTGTVEVAPVASSSSQRFYRVVVP